ncbi:hypothetical protein F5148DRAFT_1353944, partial [Russula earlei]
NPSVGSVPSQTTEDKGPLPFSFPSVLRNPGLTSRHAHLVEPTESWSAPFQPKKVWRRDDNEGKRWVRRRENARFSDNPHIATPSKRDLEPSLPVLHATFPIPLPPYLPRSAALPATAPPVRDAKASNAGQFSLSVRGMRKALRRSGPSTQALVRGVEDELTRWLGRVEVVLNPDAKSGYQFPGRAVAGLEDIREVERSPQRLVWWIEDDTWARYVVHCCARYHNIVSFSKDTSTHRLTHILRPNATQPDPATLAALATPPATDGDFSSHASFDSDAPSSLSDVQSLDPGSDVLSESDFVPEPELELAPARGHRRPRLRQPMSDIASDVDADVETDSAQGDGRGGGGGGHDDLGQAITALSLTNDDDEMPSLSLRTTAYRTRSSLWDLNHRSRSGSSPSRSPARRKPRWPLGRATAGKFAKGESGIGKESFHDFLFQ